MPPSYLKFSKRTLMLNLLFKAQISMNSGLLTKLISRNSEIARHRRKQHHNTTQYPTHTYPYIFRNSPQFTLNPKSHPAPHQSLTSPIESLSEFNQYHQ